MKATGIVRRIDDLGRVVIPKEIRRTLKIREGMPMEIFTDVSGEVILKKYSPVGEMSQIAQAYADTLVSLTGYGAAICDSEQVIAVAGAVKKELVQKQIAQQIEAVIAEKKPVVVKDKETIQVSKEIPAAAAAIYPVVTMGDALGAIMLIKTEKSPAQISNEALESLRAATMFLARQMEE